MLRMTRSLLCVLVAAALSACRAATPQAGPARPPAHEVYGYDPNGVPWALRPVLDELSTAMSERDDELALRLLDRLRAQLPPEVLVDRLESWSRLLEGRALTRELAPRLECRRIEAGPGTPERRALLLVMDNPHAEALALECAPPRLVRTSTWIDARGELARNQQTSTLDGFERLTLAGAATSEIALGEFEPAAGRALAVRERFELLWSAGLLRRGERMLPLDRGSRPDCDYVGLSGLLPTAPVEPLELLRYAEGERVRVAALVERAVRIPPARYDEALDLLAAAPLSVERIGELAPALRWLSRDPLLGDDAQGWQDWLRERHNRASAATSPALDLP